jgi:hypothetical protein
MLVYRLEVTKETNKINHPGRELELLKSQTISTPGHPSFKRRGELK